MFLAALSLGITGALFTGPFKWAHRIGGTGIDSAAKVTSDSSGAVLLAASIRSSNVYFGGALALTRPAERAEPSVLSKGDKSFDATQGDLVVFKADSSGNLLWHATASGGNSPRFTHSARTPTAFVNSSPWRGCFR